ncbi:MAG TPA: tetratricopeptide repeat protein, partial [Terriglobales bacterium]|nr:tetratricopeptide repeat protein [Terriglobales bacterium]
LTPDIEAAKLFLDIIDPNAMPRPGTNIPRALEVASSLFNPRESGSRAVILITDGDNLEGDMSLATARAAQEGIRIFAVGVGTLEGSTVPVTGASGTSYMKDQDDKVVISRLAERTLLVMARATGGRYFRSESVNLDALTAALDQMQKKQIAGGEYVEYEERYQIFLAAAFLLIFAGLLLSDRRGAWFAGPERSGLRLPGLRLLRGAGARRAESVVLLALALACGAGTARAGVGPRMRQGLALERKGKYEDALKRYQEALVEEPDNVRIRYDQGRLLYRMNRHPEAESEFQLGLLAKSKRLRARSLYNIGDCEFRQKRLDGAMASYTRALLVDPHDLEAKQNLEFCWKVLEQAKQQKDSTGTKPQNRPQPQPSRPQPRPAQLREGEISKDQAERMLQALQSKEREDMKKQQKPAKQSGGGKDW